MKPSSLDIQISVQVKNIHVNLLTLSCFLSISFNLSTSLKISSWNLQLAGILHLNFKAATSDLLISSYFVYNHI